jgi:PleD family two-component response regulator
VGACQRSPQFDTLHKLLGEADRLLYLAKAGGRNNQVRGLEPG